MVLDHPYHSIYNLLAIRNANKDEETASGIMFKRKRLTKDSCDKMSKRISVATKLIENLLKSPRRNIVKDADSLTSAYIQFANSAVPRSEDENKIKIPASCQLVTIGKNIDLPVPTVALSIDTSLEYPSKKLVKIVGFDDVFSVQGGVNLPKVIWCQSSDGVTRRQLVKSKDDLRQDSVMQQVFSVVNSLFNIGGGGNVSSLGSLKNIDSCEISSDRVVNIRTYKVIPTSQTTGLIEWCEDTIPLGDWLAYFKTGAHQRYRPKDMTPHQCKIKLHLAREHSINERIKLFKDIYNKIQPVMGYFLMENFPDSRRWFKARKSYIHSLAINSMTGFILGLGDRHVQNILLDLHTAELIHIDLGVAFDQGRLLPTPELVPFRLTRDLVHAMGPFGVEGRFKTTCCNVLNMLRSQKDVILTLIEVLLHDPLHTWTLSPQQAHLLQAKRIPVIDSFTSVGLGSACTGNSVLNLGGTHRASTNTMLPVPVAIVDQNQMAERVILELSRKLSGAVDNSYLNCEGHVNYLIQTATDVDLLSRMFYGWQAYL